MKKNLQTAFNTRQYMLSKDFEIYYYSDHNLSKVDIHSHDYYEFYFFIEGDISTQIGKSIYPIQPGDIMLIPPHIPHRPIIHSLETPYRRFVFWISQDYYQHLLKQSNDYAYLVQYVMTSHAYILHTDQITFNGVQAKVLQLIEETQGNRFGKEALLPLCVNDLIMYLNRILYYQRNPGKRNAEESSLYRNLKIYIEDHLDDDLSLEILAKEFYVSKYHIAHVFKENLGMSIHQYITKKRLVLCKEAILGDMSITEAYQTFGFGDYSSFYRAFKKEYGISPKDFRDMKIVGCD
ncbi:AraC family transcriptional regulator [Bariatricus sp. SGI.154]|uniref:AraC family transcriptional regulator n=1 Tax=Bariatricus sp. SGI.154 TaxID=3420549 RepID=UPI003D079CDA